jgi:hypothetical protein
MRELQVSSFHRLFLNKAKCPGLKSGAKGREKYSRQEAMGYGYFILFLCRAMGYRISKNKKAALFILSEAAFVDSYIIWTDYVLAGRITFISKAEKQEKDNDDNNKRTATTTSATAKSSKSSKSHKNSSSQRN